MPVEIQTVVADVAEPDGRRQVRCVPASRRLSDDEMAARPAEYPLLAATVTGLLAQAALVLPLLSPDLDGCLPADRLVELTRRALDELVLDLHWAEALAERLATVHEQRERRNLRALLRDEEDPRPRYLAAARLEVEAVRGALLDEPGLRQALAHLAADRFIDRSGDGYRLPGAGGPGAAAFHHEALREAILAHLAEVRRWKLPAPTARRRIELAREHSQILHAGSVVENSMLRAEVLRRLEDRLDRALQPADSRAEQLLELVLSDRDEDEAGESRRAYRLAEELMPLVVAPGNVAAALAAMAAGEDVVRFGSGEPPEYADPELAPVLGAPAYELEPAAPAAPAPPTDPAGVKQRLRLLRELVDEGLIDDADYQRRKAEILDRL